MLSIVSICYNNLKGLKKTLEIFENHKWGNDIELVIIDGNSTDGTKEFLNQQQITKNFISESDKGIYNAMNKGIDKANGQYLWFLNSGDYAFNEKAVQSILNAIEKNPDAIYGETMLVDTNGKELGLRSTITGKEFPENLNWKSFKMGMNIGHQSFIIKKELCLKYNENYRYVSDIDWMIRCLKQCQNIIKIPQIISCFTLDGFSTQKRKESNLERFNVLKNHYGIISNLWHHLLIIIRKLKH